MLRNLVLFGFETFRKHHEVGEELTLNRNAGDRAAGVTSTIQRA